MRPPASVAALACVVVAATALGGFAVPGASRALAVASGSVRVVDGGLELAAGTRVGVGAGLRLDASGTFPRAAVDLVRGDPDGAHVVGHLGLASGILRDGTVRLGTDPASDWLAGPRDTVTFDCRGTAVLLVDGMPRANAPLGRPCLPEPLWIVAPNALTITEVRVDGRPVPLVGRPFDPRRGALTGGAAALVLLGVAGARRRRVPADTEAPAGLPQGGGG